jgi:hypothetical protein
MSLPSHSTQQRKLAMKTSQTPTGYGFDQIMRSADHTRFPDWYARSSLLAPNRQPAAEPRQN